MEEPSDQLSPEARNHFLNVYCAQIEDQCRAALASIAIVRQFKEGPWDLDTIFWNLDHFINRAAMVSKMLWPTPSAKTKIAKWRGEILRDALGVDEQSVLNSRVLRNHLEHFDERIDAWYEGSGFVIYADRNIGPRDMMIFPNNPNVSIFRHYSPDAGVYSFHGDEVNVFDMDAELERIATAARKYNPVIKLGPDWEITWNEGGPDST